MKASKDIKKWGGNKGQDEFRLFYVSGELLRLLSELATEEEQAELIMQLVKQEHERRFGVSHD